MAEIYSTISIVCFFLAGAFFIVAIAVFFSQNVLGTIKELSGQTQASWIMSVQGKDRSKKRDSKEMATFRPKAKFKGESTTEPESMEDEVPTTFDNGEVKQGSLVGFYDRKDNSVPVAAADKAGRHGKNRGSPVSEIPTTAEQPVPLRMPQQEPEAPTLGEDQVPHNISAVPELAVPFTADDEAEEATQIETEEEATQLGEPATEDPIDNKIDFQILETILYVHTDQII